VKSLPEPNKSLFEWLLDLLSDVAARADTNKMSAKNIGKHISIFDVHVPAIVISPNLYSAPEDCDAADSFSLSQKVVHLVNILLLHKLKQRYNM
jgi:hypothetical protein